MISPARPTASALTDLSWETQSLRISPVTRLRDCGDAQFLDDLPSSAREPDGPGPEPRM